MGRYLKSEHPEQFSISCKKPSKSTNNSIQGQTLQKKKKNRSHLSGFVFYAMIYTPTSCGVPGMTED